jgi:hypothetical protein
VIIGSHAAAITSLAAALWHMAPQAKTVARGDAVGDAVDGRISEIEIEGREKLTSTVLFLFSLAAKKQNAARDHPLGSSHIMAAPPTGTPVKAEPAAAPAAKAAAPKPSIETIFKTLEYGE